jgi:transposase, IS30 family
LYLHLRGARKNCRKRYGANDSRGKLAGKRHISERPTSVQARRQVGHWEIDTVIGKGSQHCIVSLVERKTGYVLIGKLEARTVEQLNRGTLRIARRHLDQFTTITADNGSEFHGYALIEQALKLCSTSPLRTIPGNAGPTKTPTVSSANTSLRVLTWLR